MCVNFLFMSTIVFSSHFQKDHLPHFLSSSFPVGRVLAGCDAHTCWSLGTSWCWKQRLTDCLCRRAAFFPSFLFVPNGWSVLVWFWFGRWRFAEVASLWWIVDVKLCCPPSHERFQRAGALWMLQHLCEDIVIWLNHIYHRCYWWFLPTCTPHAARSEVKKWPPCLCLISWHGFTHFGIVDSKSAVFRSWSASHISLFGILTPDLKWLNLSLEAPF